MLRFLIVGSSLLVVVSLAVAQEALPVNEAENAQELNTDQRSAQAEDSEQAAEADEQPIQDPGAPKTLAGMSILGNEEAPKSLVIVPWKSSEIGDGLGVTDAIDERARPVDKEVFLREVNYYGLRSGAGS